MKLARELVGAELQIGVLSVERFVFIEFCVFARLNTSDDCEPSLKRVTKSFVSVGAVKNSLCSVTMSRCF